MLLHGVSSVSYTHLDVYKRQAYNASPEEAYLSFYLRQRLWCGRLLPQGLDAVVEATNLLEQGYQPVLAPDGHTLFLAQVPQAIQGGLAFNF